MSHKLFRNIAVSTATLFMTLQTTVASDAVWQALRDGSTVAILRHARAPGTGDPMNFKLDDCATQRNLSEEGRLQARSIGQRFKEQRVPVKQVLSSRWCRTLDTARLAFGTRVEPFPPLDSFFGERRQEEAQTRALRQVIAKWSSPGVLVLVTHQVNITALTGIFPAEGEVLVLRPKAQEGFEIVGRIRL
ncbi:histidine phosphatase family protein [Microvirga solisilvae]|uniref:histidine phosphatase family protein n=1 Tax=Microvirga solisilvae TaxID=2919498 RepID=UPI001FAEAE0B|nr:histidine phosphatase family protein [Microvirga solisilvae]